jgi:hypothetical protein
MNCPNCSSTAIQGPMFETGPRRARGVALMRCSSCRSVFDAYEWVGTTAAAALHHGFGR